MLPGGCPAFREPALFDQIDGGNRLSRPFKEELVKLALRKSPVLAGLPQSGGEAVDEQGGR